MIPGSRSATTPSLLRWGPPRGSEVVWAILVPFVLARLLVGGAYAVTRHLANELPIHPLPLALDHGLLGWDAAFYRDIAAGGYGAVPDEGLRFFPLVPLLARAVSWIPGIPTGTALLLVANVSALLCSVVLYRLAWRERRDAAFARRAVWLVSLAPPAFVLVFGYAEATLMLLATLALLGMRSGRWWVAAIAGFLAGLTRPVGVLLAVPALVEALRDRRALMPRDIAARAAAVLAPAAGLATYLAWASGRVDEALYPLRVQEDPVRRGSWRFPVTNVVDAVRDFLSGDQMSAGLHALTALLVVGLLVHLARRWPLSYTAYAGTAAILGLSAGNLDSLERYALSAIPFVLAAADITEGPGREEGVVALAAAGLVAMSILAFAGVLVP